jgi:hypothetical protein
VAGSQTVVASEILNHHDADTRAGVWAMVYVTGLQGLQRVDVMQLSSTAAWHAIM